MIKAKCEFCGKEYIKRYKKSRCCSQECYQALYRKEHRTTYTKICPVCGTEFETTNSVAKYCRKICACKARSIKSLKSAKRVSHEPRACVECGGEFIPNSNGAKYCSEECRNKGKKKAAEKKASERKSPNTKKIKKSDYPDVPSSKRWEKMNLAERSKECARYHLTYGQAQTMAYYGTLPETFGEDARNGK